MNSGKCLPVVRPLEGFSNEGLSSNQLIELRNYSAHLAASRDPKATAAECLKVDRDVRGLGRTSWQLE